MSTIHDILLEADRSMSRKESEDEYLGELRTRLVDECGVSSKRMARRLIKAYHKGDLETELGEDEEFENLIAQVRKGS